MSNKILTVRLTPELEAAMDKFKAEYGMPLAEQAKRALREWLVSKGMLKTPSGQAKSGRG